MWERALDSMLRRMVRSGRLTVTWPDGRVVTYGDGEDTGAEVELATPGIVRRMCLNPDLAFGEGYMDGTIKIDPERLKDVLLVVLGNHQGAKFPVWARTSRGLRYAIRNFVQRNAPGTARRNVAHHYDLRDELYELFLDSDMQYSCAYFAAPEMTLEQAQEAKKNHIARKMCLKPGMRVLDIGCGWGGMAMTLARDYGVQVVGITLSENQLKRGRERVAQAGLAGQIMLDLADYRSIDGHFDSIVSVGMLEHVGAPNYGTYFAKVRELLAEDGVALIHTIGRCNPPTAHAPWLNKYIFPGGYVPSLSEVSTATEHAGLWLADLEIWREHYAHTIANWRQRFEERLDRVRQMFDERFVRMWRFYLVACEASFLVQRLGVFQLQISRRMMAVPNTRDYLYGQTQAMSEGSSTPTSG